MFKNGTNAAAIEYRFSFTHEGNVIKSKLVDSLSAERVGEFRRFDSVEEIAETVKQLSWQEDVDLYTNFIGLLFFQKFRPVRNCNVQQFEKDLIRKVLLPYTFRSYPSRPADVAPAHLIEKKKIDFVVPENRCAASVELETHAELERIVEPFIYEKVGEVCANFEESGGAKSNVPCLSAFVCEEIGASFVCESYGITSPPCTSEALAIEVFDGMKNTAMLEMYPMATRKKVVSANVCSAYARIKQTSTGLDVLCPKTKDAVVLCAGVGARHMCKYLLKKNVRATITAHTDAEELLGPAFHSHSHLILNYPVPRHAFEKLSERFAVIFCHPKLKEYSGAIRVPGADGWWMTDDYHQTYPLDLPFYNEGRYLTDDVEDTFVFSPEGVDATLLQTAQNMNIKLGFERGGHEFYRYFGHTAVDGKADVELLKLEHVIAPPVEYALCPRTLVIRPYTSVITLSYCVRRGQFLELPGTVTVVRGKVSTFSFHGKTLLHQLSGPVTVRYRYLGCTIQCVIVPG